MNIFRILICCVIPCLFACLPKKPEVPLTAVPAGQLVAALEQHRRAFQSLKALAAVTVVKRGRKRVFENVAVTVDRSRFRIEAFGPLGQSIFAFVWDGKELFYRMPEETSVNRAGQDGLERLLGPGLGASELCSILAGNVPDAQAEEKEASLFCSQDGECALELRTDSMLHRVRLHYIADIPDRVEQDMRIESLELSRSGEIAYRVRFERMQEISHYRLPISMVIENPKNDISIRIVYDDADVNTPVDEESFMLSDRPEPDEAGRHR